jgi:hypothetical protein
MIRKEDSSMILQRTIEKVRSEKWDEYVALVREMDVEFTRQGVPLTKRDRAIAGGDTWTAVHEREWASLAAYEATMAALVLEAETTKRFARVSAMIEERRVEFYRPL